MTFVLLCCFVVCSRRAAGFPERHLRPCLLRPPEHRGRHRYGQERRGVHQADARLVRGEGGGTRVRGPTMPRQGANTARMPAAPSAGPSSGVTGGGQAFSKNRANKRFGKSIRSRSPPRKSLRLLPPLAKRHPRILAQLGAPRPPRCGPRRRRHPGARLRTNYAPSLLPKPAELAAGRPRHTDRL
jgi:hypothetical protein